MSTATLTAWHNDPAQQQAALAEMEKHRKADALVQGYGYWKDGKGCAVGCLIKSGNHAEYESRFGIPQMLAHLEDRIFEGLPREDAIAWPERFLSAARPGADLSLVGWQFLHWLLTDETVTPGINHPLVRDAVQQCADVLVPLTKGESVDKSAARSAAASAEGAARNAVSAVSAESAAWSAAWSAESAAWSAESAENAAWSAARSAARSAESAAWSAARSAENAVSAAWSAESAENAASAAWSAAVSAVSAVSAAESAAWKAMSDKLVSLMQAA